MKKLKYEMIFIILFMSVGIAAVSTNIFINGSTPIASNPDDFNVYFSNVLVNGTQDLSLVQSETSLVFTGEFNAVGDKKEISYAVTNASKNYDADIDISCTGSTTYLTISNSFDTSSNLTATTTRNGILTVTLNKSYTGTDLIQDISCTITASAVERTSQGKFVVPDKLKSGYSIGDDITIENEQFKVLSQTDDTITLFAANIINSIGRQVSDYDEEYATTIADNYNWTYYDGTRDIDFSVGYGGDIGMYFDEYNMYFEYELEIPIIDMRLISLKELKTLGCAINDDYSNDDSYSCYSSPYSDFIFSSGCWWTSSVSENAQSVWVLQDGVFELFGYNLSCGVRPVITLDKTYIQ